MHLIRALSIIFGFLALGEAVIHFTGMKLPGSIIGMALLFVSLHMKWVKAAWLQGLVDVMMANLSLFLVPPCRGDGIFRFAGRGFLGDCGIHAVQHVGGHVRHRQDPRTAAEALKWKCCTIRLCCCG